MERALYDNKRQHASTEVMNEGTWLSGKTYTSKNDVTGCTPPYDFTMAFWTICPHCQKLFAYYQLNILIRCEECGKTFFAFKLHEQAVPSRYLSAPPNNSRVQPYQQHGLHSQQIQSTTGGRRNSMVHATGDKRPDDDGVCNCSETRSNVVQVPAAYQTHTPSLSRDNGTTQSVTPDPLDPNSSATQNLSREDASAVSFISLKIPGKRKHDDGTDNSYNRNSCDDKKQMKNILLSDADLCDDKMFDGQVAGTDDKSAGHVPSEVGNQKEQNEAHDGIQCWK